MKHDNDMNDPQDDNFIVEGEKSFLKKTLLVLAPICVLLVAGVGFVAMGSLKPKPQEKDTIPTAAPVVTAMAQSQTIELRVQSQGEVRPRSEINVSAQVSGKITYISPDFLEGGQFKKGNVLFRLEQSDYDLRITQAQANVAQAQTALTRELSEAEIARKDWEDLGQGTASPLSLREPQVAEQRANLASATARLDEAKLNQTRTIIYAPFDGRVQEKSVSFGEYITPGQKLGRIYGVDMMDIKLPLTDTDLAKLGLGIGFKQSANKTGPKVTLSTTIAGKHHEWQGRLVRTDSRYDSATRILYGYVEVKNPYGSSADKGAPLASGLFVDAAIGGREIIESTIIPRTALRGTDTVYIATDENTLMLRTVEVASSSRMQVVITSGLSAGEMVIISPVRGAADGMKIEIAKPSKTKEEE